MLNQASALAKELGRNGYAFSGNQSMSQGWKLGTNIIGWALLYGVMYYVMQFVAGFIPVVGPIGFALVVGPCLSGGLIMFIHHKNKTGNSDFGLIFKGFNYLGALIVAVILCGLIIVGIMIPLFFIAWTIIGIEGLQIVAEIARDINYVTDPMDIVRIYVDIISAILPAFMIIIIGVSLMATFLTFVTHFIVLTGCSATEAISASFNIVKKNFFKIWGTLFLLGIVQVVSMLPFGLGLIVTIPWTLATVYAMFNQIILSKIDEEGGVSSDPDLLDN